MLRLRFPLLALLAGLLTIWMSLGCMGYTITKVEEPPAEEEVVDVVEPAPVASARPAARPTPAPAPEPAPVATGGAGQIQVTTTAAVQAIVDGVPVAFDPMQGFVVDVRAGTHTLEIMNLLGKIQASEQVEVPAGKRVRFTYRKKELTSSGAVDATALPPPPTLPEPPAPVVVKPDPGSVQITGLSAYADGVWINGFQVGYASSTSSFVQSGLEPGSHALRVESARQVIYEGPVDVRSGENHRCLLEIRGWERVLDCHYTRPAL